MRAIAAILLLTAVSARAAALPGFRVELLGSTAGFASSLGIDSQGTLYYTTTRGDLFRIENGQSVLVAHVRTDAGGDSGLLGMALRDDHTAVVHYTTPGQIADVLSTIDLTTGTETILHSFVCDIEFPTRGSSSEHHGGNPIVGADGSIFVGIGDYGGRLIASLPEWNAGKVFRLDPAGAVTQFARGFRNPFDMSWDAANQRLIVPDNGAAIDDEINIVHQGDYCGWPFTMGNGPAIDGAVAPIYVFPTIVAPTGFIAVGGHNTMLRRGYLLAAFVTKALYYIPDMDARPLPDPIALIRGETGSIIDVAEAPSGDVYFVTGNAVYRLIVPMRGDCDGNGKIDAADLDALRRELDLGPHAMTAARASWGCDVNGDGLIDTRDLTALFAMVSFRARAVRGH